METNDKLHNLRHSLAHLLAAAVLAIIPVAFLATIFLATVFLTAAFLAAQLDEANRITNERLRIWDYYHQIFEAFEEEGLVSRPKIPSYSKHNAHMYYLILSNSFERSEVLRELREQNIFAVSHYVPLHSSPAGLMYGKVGSAMDVTNHISDKIIRLPLWIGLTQSDQDRIAESLKNILKKYKF